MFCYFLFDMLRSVFHLCIPSKFDKKHSKILSAHFLSILFGHHFYHNWKPYVPFPDWFPINHPISSSLLWELLFCFAVKSLSVIFSAICSVYCLCLFGLGLCGESSSIILALSSAFSVPYWIGHHFGSDLIDHLIDKYPKLQQIQKLGISNQIMLSYLLRIVSVLPGDLCSLFSGSLLNRLQTISDRLTAGTFSGNDSPCFICWPVLTKSIWRIPVRTYPEKSCHHRGINWYFRSFFGSTQ